MKREIFRLLIRPESPGGFGPRGVTAGPAAEQHSQEALRHSRQLSKEVQSPNRKPAPSPARRLLRSAFKQETFLFLKPVNPQVLQVTQRNLSLAATMGVNFKTAYSSLALPRCRHAFTHQRRCQLLTPEENTLVIH